MMNFSMLDALDLATWIYRDGEPEYANTVARRLYPDTPEAVRQRLHELSDNWQAIGKDSPRRLQARAASWGDDDQLLVQVRTLAPPVQTEMFVDLLDSLPQRLACLDRDNTLLWLNQPLAKKFGLRREDMVGMSLHDFLPSTVAGEMTQASSTARQSGASSHYYSGGSRTGSDSELVSELVPLQSQSDCDLVVICTDVSLQQPARSQAASKTAVLERIARADPLPTVLGKVVEHARRYSNARSALIMLAEPNEATDESSGRHFSVHAEDMLPDFVRQILQGQAVSSASGPCGSSVVYGRRQLVDDIPAIAALRSIESELRQTGINACWSEPISSPSGKVVGSLVLYFEKLVSEEQNHELISSAALAAGIAIERDQAERRLISVNAKLEQRVVERTHALTQSLREVERARIEAESATHAKSRFLAAASHDLRQPLQALSLYLSALQANPPEQGIGEITDKIGNAVTAMNDTLASLLDITSISNGKINATQTPFSIAETLARLKAVHDPRAKAAGLNFQIESCDSKVLSNQSLFYRILDNLLTNAISYTERGTVQLRCIIDGPHIRIEVSDTGVGIESSQHERIFEEYVQLRNPGRTRKMGMGLGLAVVAQLCKLLGHEVQVASEPGVGSTFSIRATLANGSAEDRIQPLISQPAALSEQQDEGNPCIIFVDDDEDIVDAMTMMMQHHRLNLHTCFRADEVIALIENGIEPDLLITDLRLPDMPGTDLIREARRIVGDDLPAILITGYAGSFDSSESPGVELLKKPVRTEALLSMIESKLARPVNV